MFTHTIPEPFGEAVCCLVEALVVGVFDAGALEGRALEDEAVEVEVEVDASLEEAPVFAFVDFLAVLLSVWL